VTVWYSLLAAGAEW